MSYIWLLVFVALLYDFPRLSYASTNLTFFRNYRPPLPQRFYVSKKVCHLLFKSSECRLKRSMACNRYTVISEVLRTASIPSNKAYEIVCKPYTTFMTVYQSQAMLHLSMCSLDSKWRRANLCGDKKPLWRWRKEVLKGTGKLGPSVNSVRESHMVAQQTPTEAHSSSH